MPLFNDLSPSVLTSNMATRSSSCINCADICVPSYPENAAGRKLYPVLLHAVYGAFSGRGQIDADKHKQQAASRDVDSKLSFSRERRWVRSYPTQRAAQTRSHDNEVLLV